MPDIPFAKYHNITSLTDFCWPIVFQVGSKIELRIPGQSKITETPIEEWDTVILELGGDKFQFPSLMIFENPVQRKSSSNFKI